MPARIERVYGLSARAGLGGIVLLCVHTFEFHQKAVTDGFDFPASELADQLSDLGKMCLPDFVHGLLPQFLPKRSEPDNIGVYNRQRDSIASGPFVEKSGDHAIRLIQPFCPRRVRTSFTPSGSLFRTSVSSNHKSARDNSETRQLSASRGNLSL